MIQQKLELLRGLQKKYHDLHVGGSIGLLIHGFDLHRNLDSSDLDLVKISDEKSLKNADLADDISNVEDFDYSIEFNGIRVDVKIDPDQECVIKVYEGHAYKVSLLEQILFYKCQYALKGIDKHKDDIKILLGVVSSRSKMDLAL